MTENVQAEVTEQPQQQHPQEQPQQQQQAQEQQVRLVDVAITNQNIALNVVFSFVALAQQRGVFNIQESAKIWECIKLFRPDAQQQPQTNSIEQSVENAVNEDLEKTD